MSPSRLLILHSNYTLRRNIYKKFLPPFLKNDIQFVSLIRIPNTRQAKQAGAPRVIARGIRIKTHTNLEGEEQ